MVSQFHPLNGSVLTILSSNLDGSYHCQVGDGRLVKAEFYPVKPKIGSVFELELVWDGHWEFVIINGNKSKCTITKTISQHRYKIRLK